MVFAHTHAHPLSDFSAQLLLVLCYQPPIPHSEHFLQTSYLSEITDRDFDDHPHSHTEVDQRPHHHQPEISFALLFDALCDVIDNEWGLLLLFTMLNHNSHFCESVYSKSDVDIVVLPLLHKLYQEEDLTSNRVYMILVVLLILTQVRF